MKNNNLINFTCCLLSIFILTGCSVKSESWINTNRLEVHDDQFTDTIPTDKIDNAMINAIASYHSRYGNGTINASVSFDPASKINTKNKAINAAKKLQDGLKRNGINDVKVGIASSPATGDISTTVITFPAIIATAPQDCGSIPGYMTPNDIQDNANHKPVYKFGCTVETLLARQVSRPSDLLGKNGFETNSDGRRQERVLSTRGYYGDTPNKDLNGENASEGN